MQFTKKIFNLRQNASLLVMVDEQTHVLVLLKYTSAACQESLPVTFQNVNKQINKTKE